MGGTVSIPFFKFLLFYKAKMCDLIRKKWGKTIDKVW